MSRYIKQHSGTLKLTNLEVENDLTINGNLEFADVTAGVLGVTGGIDLSGTTSAVGIDLNGGTFSTGAISLGDDDKLLFGAGNDASLEYDEDGTDNLRYDGADMVFDTATKLLFRDSGLSINSSVDGQLDLAADGELELTSPTVTIGASTILNMNASINVADTLAGGAANGNIIKKTLQAGEAYTTTTAGLMVKNYCADGTVTVPSGEFTGLYVNVKGLHVSPGNNASLISAHVHGSNTTVIHAGLWLYGDMTNGVKASGSTLTNMIDISEATSVTNFAAFPAAGTDPVVATVEAGDGEASLKITVGGTTKYLHYWANAA